MPRKYNYTTLCKQYPNVEFFFWSLFSRTEHLALRQKCRNTEFFLVRIQENTDQKKLGISTHVS